jgi:hypothetical protein
MMQRARVQLFERPNLSTGTPGIWCRDEADGDELRPNTIQESSACGGRYADRPSPLTTAAQGVRNPIRSTHFCDSDLTPVWRYAAGLAGSGETWVGLLLVGPTAREQDLATELSEALYPSREP